MGEAGASIREQLQRFGLGLNRAVAAFSMQVWMLGWHAGVHAGYAAAMSNRVPEAQEHGTEPVSPMLRAMDVSMYPWGGH